MSDACDMTKGPMSWHLEEGRGNRWAIAEWEVVGGQSMIIQAIFLDSPSAMRCGGGKDLGERTRTSRNG